MTDVEKPTAEELEAAYRTIRKLIDAVPLVRDAGLAEIHFGVVEAGRMVAVATSYLGSSDPTYRAAWGRMMDLE